MCIFQVDQKSLDKLEDLSLQSQDVVELSRRLVSMSNAYLLALISSAVESTTYSFLLMNHLFQYHIKIHVIESSCR